MSLQPDKARFILLRIVFMCRVHLACNQIIWVHHPEVFRNARGFSLSVSACPLSSRAQRSTVEEEYLYALLCMRNEDS